MRNGYLIELTRVGSHIGISIAYLHVYLLSKVLAMQQESLFILNEALAICED